MDGTKRLNDLLDLATSIKELIITEVERLQPMAICKLDLAPSAIEMNCTFTCHITSQYSPNHRLNKYSPGYIDTEHVIFLTKVYDICDPEMISEFTRDIDHWLITDLTSL